MKYILLLICISVPLPSISGPLLTPEKIRLIEQGERALLNARWHEARRLFDSLSSLDSADPVGYLYAAAAMQSEMVAREESFDKEKFMALLDTTKVLAEKALTNCSTRDSALCYLYLGHQYAYRAVWETRFGSTLSAISYGFKAKGQYHNGFDADSTLYDLYLGLGTYHYWKTVKAGILKLTGLFKNDRKKGIKEIRLAIDSSLFSKEAARSALVWVLINEEAYDEAIVLSEEMSNRYPEGNFFLWPMAESYYRSKRYAEAARIYDRLLDRLKTAPDNYYNIIEALYYLYQCYDRIDQDDDAVDVVRYFDSIHEDIPKNAQRRQKGKISFLKREH